MDLDPEHPGVAVYCYEKCVQKVIFCVKHEMECERKSTTDPEFWYSLVARGFVLKVREKP